MLELARALGGRRLDPPSRLLVGQLVMFTGISALFPIVPLYVAAHGGGSLAIALFVAGPMVANMLVQVPAGHLVDRFGRKPVLIGSRVAFAVLSLALFLDVGPLWLLAALRCGQGASSGAYVPALRAALADLTPVERRGERYAQLQAVEMVGLLIGPAIGGAIALWRYSGIFLCAGLAVFIGIVPLLRLTEPRSSATDEGGEPAPRGWWRGRAILVPSLALAASGAMFSMYDVVWPQYLTVRSYGPFLIGLSISLFALPVLVLARRAGRLSDRGNRRVLVAGAFLIVACCASFYPFIRSLPLILGFGFIEACGFTLIEPTLFAVISETAAPEVRGRAMGMGGFLQFGGSALGATVLGTLYGVAEPLPFWGGAGCCVAAATIAAIWLPRRRVGAAPLEPAPMAAVLDAEIQA